MDVNSINKKMELFQSNIMQDLQKRMKLTVEEIMQEWKQNEFKVHEFGQYASVHSNQSNLDNALTNNSHSEQSDKININKSRKKLLSQKEFKNRESYLTNLLEIDHMRTIYNICVVMLILFSLQNVIYEYIVEGSISFGLTTFSKGFYGIHIVFGIWFIQFLFMITVFYGLKIWSQIRNKLENKKSLQHLWSLACLTIYIASQLAFVYIPGQLCLKFKFTYISGMVLLIETSRMIMKMHAFVRTVAARLLEGKLKSDSNENIQYVTTMPSIQKYIYFLFAPTLLYRDNYPRTSAIRWKFAFSRLMEIVGGSFLYSYIYENHILFYFGNFGKEDITAASIVLKLYGMLLPCTLVYLGCFFMILHSWQNFTSEILRFGDRMFYRDWWTVGNYDTYYRTWNIVVHDWLYEYIYKDFYVHIFKGSKVAASLVVFLISAIFHEYIIGYALQIFFPIMFIFFFVVGEIMIIITRLLSKNLGNILIWLSLIAGNTLMISLYTMEYFTSRNCPKMSYDSWSDILVPHLWTCYNK